MMQLPIMRQRWHELILVQMLGVDMSRVKIDYGSYIRSHKQGRVKGSRIAESLILLSKPKTKKVEEVIRP